MTENRSRPAPDATLSSASSSAGADVVICSAVRTATGRLSGVFRDFTAPQLGEVASREALRRANIDPASGLVDEVIFGNVLQAGVGQNPARQVAIKAGLPVATPAFTVNKVCGSSLKAAMLAAQAIKAGDARIILVGGMESMTNAPHLARVRQGVRYGSAALEDSINRDGLQDAFSGIIMGVTGEIVAREFGISRKEADAFAEESHRRAAAATARGAFKDEIVPVEVREGKGAVRVIDRDEGIRPDTTQESLGRLRPAFEETGVVTAGNASQLSDGASALVIARRDAATSAGLPIMARIRAYGTAGVEPERVMAAPIYGVRSLLERQKLSVRDVDLFEHNEAFATASCAVATECGIPRDRFNIHGGAIALGHPLGASGARILTTLLYAMRQGDKHRGLATLCLGGGNAVTMIVERE
ncbi:MAG: acetyl-CoA C-acyltransferase [Thermoplasmatota archaeon]